MIKSTFYNLPPAKRERIIAAINHEFKRVHLNKISINSIIKEAGISRGSFYQYFDDKGDLFEVIANEIADCIKSIVTDSLTKHKGDIFKTFEDLLNYLLDKSFKNETLKKFNESIPPKSQNVKIILDRVQYNISNNSEFIINNIDTSKFKSKSAEYLKTIFSLLMSITRDAHMKFVVDKQNPEEIRELYNRKIQIIQYGCFM